MKLPIRFVVLDYFDRQNHCRVGVVLTDQATGEWAAIDNTLRQFDGRDSWPPPILLPPDSSEHVQIRRLSLPDDEQLASDGPGYFERGLPIGESA